MSGLGPKTAKTFNVPPPSNYVAGVGRGAQGFTTRSDIGPAKPTVNEVQFGQAPAGYVAGRGRGMGELAREQQELSTVQVQQEQDRGDYSESMYDQFSGYQEGLFNAGAYEEDDVEADQIYSDIDKVMESRRKRSREQQMLLEQKKAKAERPRIADQFADLKRELSTVTMEQWDAIPDIVADHTLKYKQTKKKETFTPLPDSMIDQQARGSILLSNIDPRSGLQSSISGLAEARGTAMIDKLDKISDSVSGQTVVDPRGMLTQIQNTKVNSQSEVSDIKKARLLLQSVITTNPKHGPGWIAAARVEEVDNKMQQARKIIIQGCEQCPESEDVWLEAARLHPNETAKTILANAVLQLPTSVKIWLKAAELEHTEARKKLVLRRSLEFVPNSVVLWKAAIELENVTDARIMLARAVECVPQSTEMWLALAKLETHENARKVLNQAREAIPTERATWITAAKLEEAHGNTHLVGRIIDKMMVSLSQYQVVIDRDTWIKEAEEAEHTNYPVTCAAIVKNTIHLGVEEEDRKNTWIDDAETCVNKTPPSVHTARAIYNHALSIFPTKKSLWQLAAMFEREYGTREQLDEILKKGVQNCPQAEVLWLMAAKETWIGGNNVPGARTILVEAFNANPSSQQILLAAVKLEWETGEYQRARVLLAKAREKASSEVIWMKSALLEWEMAEYTTELKLLDEAIVKYPTYTKYYMMAGQVCEQSLKDDTRAYNYYQQGLKMCPDCVVLWKLRIRLEERVKGVARARSTAEQARKRLTGNDEIWLESIRLERRTHNEKLGQILMAKALQECPTSGLLWAEEIHYCSRAQQKSISLDALKKTNNDPLVVLAVARLFQRNHKIYKARKWYERSIIANAKSGDAWCYYYAFEFVQSHKKEVAIAQNNKSKANNGGVAYNTNSNGNNNGNNKQNNGLNDEVDEDEEDHTAGIDSDDDEDDDVNKNSDAIDNTSNIENKPDNNVKNGDSVIDNNSNNNTNSNITDPSEQILQRAIQAEPNQGELWCHETKQLPLRRQTLKVKIQTVAEQILGLPGVILTHDSDKME